MVRVLLRAAFVGPSGEELRHLRVALLGLGLDGLHRGGIAHEEGDLAALALGPAAPALDAASGDARGGADPVLGRALGVEDVELGNADVAVANELRLADDLAVGVPRLEVGSGVAAARAARLSLGVRGDDVPVAVGVGQPVRGGRRLALEAEALILAQDGIGRGPPVLHVPDLAAAGQPAAERAHAARRLLVDPPGVGEVVGVGAGSEVVGFVEDPVDGGLEAHEAAALRGGLRHDELVLVAETFHGEGLRMAADEGLLGLTHDVSINTL